ncbi:unnamed protein product [Caenorhabditis brenneri]
MPFPLSSFEISPPTRFYSLFCFTLTRRKLRRPSVILTPLFAGYWCGSRRLGSYFYFEISIFFCDSIRTMGHLSLILLLTAIFSCTRVIAQTKTYERCYDLPFMEECSQKYDEFNEILGNFQFKAVAPRKRLLAVCPPLIQCFSELAHCDIAGDPEIYPLIENVQLIYDLVIFLDDSPCLMKLKSKESDCYKSWKEHIPLNALSNTLTRKVACWTYFGKNACMEEEMTRLCGQKEWAGFRDIFLTLVSKHWEECHAAEVYTGLVMSLTNRNEKWKMKYGL